MGHNVQIRAVFCARKSTSAALAGLPGTITRPHVVGTVINASVKNPGNQTQRIYGHHHRCLYTSIPECPYAPALTPREPRFRHSDTGSVPIRIMINSAISPLHHQIGRHSFPGFCQFHPHRADGLVTLLKWNTTVPYARRLPH